MHIKAYLVLMHIKPWKLEYSGIVGTTNHERTFWCEGNLTSINTLWIINNRLIILTICPHVK
jgi:hypothetical protein